MAASRFRNIGDPLLSVEVGSSGLPEMDDDLRERNVERASRNVVAFMILPRLFCMCIALVVYTLGGRAWYDAEIKVIEGRHQIPLYFAVVVFSVLVDWLTLWPTILKARIFHPDSGNLRANMTVYKLSVPSIDDPMPYIVMEDEGPIGEYNRANRSMFNFNEGCASFVLNMVFAGQVFPCPALVAAILFAVGRIMHMCDYSKGGFGAHANGYMVSMLSHTVLEMLTWFVAIKGLFGI
eukprot:CAMPEP_0183419396 /NCGR_PEP_ID=MMETSP0370-20130417/25756_1 /TAXON_ID=268820 /ORGANISM="Peridinium aciculiferum, Strain PAER-2" /LENGTH=236 /DNA_ID=CAMNT_0025603189 /DNA_START=69 /DNA_END=779 /DNA_ORIENTATION=-